MIQMVSLQKESLIEVEESLSNRRSSSNIVACMVAITFNDDDLLLGSMPHNRPLFIFGYARERKINRILLDRGSIINILPLHMLKELAISTKELM